MKEALKRRMGSLDIKISIEPSKEKREDLGLAPKGVPTEAQIMEEPQPMPEMPAPQMAEVEIEEEEPKTLAGKVKKEMKKKGM